MRHTNWLLAISALISVASCKPKYDEVLPKYGPVTEAVFASGSIEPKDAYTLTSMSDGFLVKSFVTENDIVKDGQVLFQLDNKQQNTQVAIAENNLNYAEQNVGSKSPQLLQIKAQVDAAAIKKANDSTTYQRYLRLVRTQSVAQQEVDNARLAYESSVSSYESAVANYRATLNKVNQDLANSRAQLQNVKLGYRFYELNAIGISKVYQIFKKQGDLVRKGEQVAQLGNPDSIVINLDIDEANIAKIQLGQKVLVELNTQKNKTYEAVVTKIYPHFNDNSQSYKVEARFTTPEGDLISGTQLQANIVTAIKDKALLIPRIYLMPDNKVLVKKGDAYDTAKLAVGIVSDEWVEVLSGISATTTIAKQK